MNATLLCNAGLCFRCGGSAVLVDALNQPVQSFKAIPEDTAQKIVAGEPPFERVDGLFYTHLHGDHYDRALNDAFLAKHPDVKTFFPSSQTPEQGRLEAGAFTLEYHAFTHTPCLHEVERHCVLLLTAGDCTVYLAGDAALDVDAHLAILAGRQVDYAFFNSMYLSHPETRALLREAFGRVYIYHMPESATDNSGICRKVQRNFERYPEELRDIQVLQEYPAELELPGGVC